MEPRIQYAKTEDGVSIAFWTLEKGTPLIYMPSIPVSHIQMEWQWPEYRRWYERLAEKRMVVRYDGRGSGLSDREVSDFSLEAHVLDLEAVVDRCGAESFALLGNGDSGPVAIAYAARHPQRVSHLLLWCTWARASDYHLSPEYEAELALRDKDWELYTETLAHITLGLSEGEHARHAAAYLRGCMTPEVLQATYAVTQHFDVAHLLPEVRSPALVLHRAGARFQSASIARGLAARIPNARLALLEGEALVPFLGDSEAVLQAINEFLGEGEEAAATRAEAPEAGALRTVLFTDVEGSTALTQRLGDAKARDVLREHERIVREALKSHGGAEVKTMGDGFMASFSSATGALECAIAMQRTFEERNASLPAHPEPVEGRAEPQPSAHGSRTSPRADRDAGAPTFPAHPEPVEGPEPSAHGSRTSPRADRDAVAPTFPAHTEPVEGRAEPQPSAHGSRTSPRADRDAGASLAPLRVRIGLNAGEPIAEEDDLFGTAVIEAARIAAAAKGGEILVSNVVKELAKGKDFRFTDRGETLLKGFDEPVRLYEVCWREDR